MVVRHFYDKNNDKAMLGLALHCSKFILTRKSIVLK